MAGTYISATDSILSRVNTDWLALTPSIVGGSAPALVFEMLEADLKPHPRDQAHPWARVVVRHSDGDKVSLAGDQGTGLYNRTGLVWAQVFVPGDTGAAGYTLGQRLAVVLRNSMEGQRAGPVVFKKVAVSDRPKDGAWWTFDVKAGFIWYEVH